MELANKLGARYTLIVGDNEIAVGPYALKNMTIRRAGKLSRRDRELLKTYSICESSVPLDFLGDLAAPTPAASCAPPTPASAPSLMGWVHRRRDLGGVIFIHLRDRDGVTQVVFHADVGRRGPRARRDAALGVRGRGRRPRRRCARRTPSIRRSPTGEVEVVADKIWILNESRTPPFPDGREGGRQRRRAAEVPLRGSAPAAHAAQHHPALEDLVRRAAVCTRRGSSRSRRRS